MGSLSGACRPSSLMEHWCALVSLIEDLAAAACPNPVSHSSALVREALQIAGYCFRTLRRVPDWTAVPTVSPKPNCYVTPAWMRLRRDPRSPPSPKHGMAGRQRRHYGGPPFFAGRTSCQWTALLNLPLTSL